MQEDFVLEDISFKIKKGDKIAIVGFNGAGKITLIKLMLGLYHPFSGEILINGIDIEKFNRKILYDLFSAVFQEITPFSLSLQKISYLMMM